MNLLLTSFWHSSLSVHSESLTLSLIYLNIPASNNINLVPNQTIHEKRRGERNKEHKLLHLYVCIKSRTQTSGMSVAV